MTSRSKTKKSVYKNQRNNHIIPCFVSKPEQGKKTIEVSTLINNDLTKNPHVLNISIPMNRRNQANQLNNTFQKYMPYVVEQKDINFVPTLHGDKASSKDPDGYIYRARNKNQRLIICLSNPTRTTIVLNIITEWLTCPGSLVKIYIDEAGDSSTLNCVLKHIWSKLEQNGIYDLNRVKMILIDAHADGIIENKNFVKYFPLKSINKLENEYNLENYMFFSSLPFEIHEWEDTVSILESYKNGTITIDPSDYILFPTSFTKENQYSEAENIVDVIEDIVVLIINGDGYHVFSSNTLPRRLRKSKCGKNTNCKQITCPKCFPEAESELYCVEKIKNKYAKGRPFALCGNSCINRAMTYHKPTMPFTKTFVSNSILMKPFNNCTNIHEATTATKENTSQMVKRICNSFKYQLSSPPIYYGPQGIYDTICDLEKKSKWISENTGFVTSDTIHNMTTLKVNEDELINAMDPSEFYLKIFRDLPKDINIIHSKLDEFRKDFCGMNVRATTIEHRIDGIEPDEGFLNLSLSDYRNNYNILKIGIDNKTKSRIRVIKMDNQIYWAITVKYERSEFRWKNKKFKLDKENESDCLFTHFIQSKIVNDLTPKQLKTKIKRELADNQSKYDGTNEFSEEDWDDECDKIKVDKNLNNTMHNHCIQAISDLFNVNVFMFVFEELQCGGFEFTDCNPLLVPRDSSKGNFIYLKKTNNTYNLMIEQ